MDLENVFISRIDLNWKYIKQSLLKPSRFVRNKQLMKWPSHLGFKLLLVSTHSSPLPLLTCVILSPIA
jgi:hypothetical protein